MTAVPRLLRPGDEACPRELEGIDPPIGPLWVLGREPAELGPKVAIVGARHATPYGLEIAQALAADLVACGICVVSGMALGIDTAAHEGALGARGCTVAVLGSGADVPYPAQNRGLHERIQERGSVVSPFPPGARPFKVNFPRRNRVIAALSLGVVVVQGKARSSGALSTAAAAREIGRDVLAVPGDVRSELSGGPHDLIRAGAAICTGVGDVLAALELELRRAVPTAAAPLPPGLDEDSEAVLRALSDGPARPDQVAASLARGVVEVGRALSRLELAGLAGRDPAGIYRRLR